MLLLHIVVELSRRGVRTTVERVSEPPCVGCRFFARLATKLDDEPSVAIGEQRAPRCRQTLVLQVLKDAAVDTLERDRLEPVAEPNVITGGEQVLVAEDDQRAYRRAVHETQLGLQHRDARALGADQRARDVEPMFGKQLVQRISGHEPRNSRKSLANEVAVRIANGFQTKKDLFFF